MSSTMLPRRFAQQSYITSDSGDAGFFDSMTWLAGATPFSTGSDGQSVTINLSNDSKVKTFVDFWQKMIDDDLIDTKTAGWSDDWNKSLNDGSIASLLTGAWMPYNLLSGAPDGEGKWRVAQMPTPDGSETNSENGGSSLAMVKTDDKAKAEAAYKFAEYACHNAEGIKTRVAGGAFPADNDTLASDDFLNMTSLTDSDGNAHEYFGGQKFNEELAKLRPMFRLATSSCRSRFMRVAYIAMMPVVHIPTSPSPLLKVFRLGKRISRIMHLSRATP